VPAAPAGYSGEVFPTWHNKRFGGFSLSGEGGLSGEPGQARGLRRSDVGLVMLWLALLAAVLFIPRLTESGTLGDDLTRFTVRLALAYYAVAALLLLRTQPEEWEGFSTRVRLARWCWTLAWATYLVHLGMAFHYYHHWSHADAVDHTQAVSGVGEGIYVSHLFTVVWTADVTCWWGWPRRYATRSPWIDRLLHSFMAFVVFNATVVYEHGIIRWAGILLFGILAAAWLTRARRSFTKRDRMISRMHGSNRHLLLTGMFAFVFASFSQAEDLGLRVAPGFRVTLYADHELANDIFAMTLDRHGRVVVTGPGYVKVLEDTKGTGKADKATVWATPHTGGMGLCFDGDDLYYCGDGWFSRYRDPRGLSHAEGPPEHIVPLAFAEHGGHAMRKGPDGWWYIIGGNDSGINRQHITLPNSPVRDPEAGALLRLTPDCKRCEIIAHGFRNPYDFDFNAAGDLFAYDSDVERDYFLPWYSPTRIYHIAYGGHHGWRLPSYLRSWCRKDFYLDTVDILWPVGRGSPTGVACYRHDQFPEHYRGGFFALDWTFGKVYFFPLQPEGASYRTQPEVFLEATGTSGFDPTDIVVAPDGSLFISMGGRGTRGAVFKIEYTGAEQKDHKPPTSDLEAVLAAPQPFDAWSRARWVPLARKLGAEPFAAAVVEETRDATTRMRAVEVLTELFGGLPNATAAASAKASSSLVRARVAWSLDRILTPGGGTVLHQLARDEQPRVRLYALNALADHLPQADLGAIRSLLPANLGHADKRIRQAAARLASLLPEDTWRGLLNDVKSESTQFRLTAALASIWRSRLTDPHDDVIDTVLTVLPTTTDTGLRLQAVRLFMLAFGDYHLHDPSFEIYTAYSTQNSLAGRERQVSRILDAVRPFFPCANERLNEETARLLAMLEDDDPSLPRKVAEFWTTGSSPTSDVHYLIVFSRLRGPRDAALTKKVAQTLLALHSKLQGQEQRTKQVWSERLSELLVNLQRRDPALADELLRQPDYVKAGHVALAANLPLEQRLQAARLFLAAVQKDPNFGWSGPLVDLLGLLPAEEAHPVFRAQWADFGLRDDILLHLATKPEAADRDKFLTGLESNQEQVIQACLGALERLPRDSTPGNLVPLLRLLRRLEQEPKERLLRARTVALFSRQTGQPFTIEERSSDATALRRTYQPLFSWFEHAHSGLVRKLNDADEDDPAVWNRVLAEVDWNKGNAARGEILFRTRACQSCHSGSRALGPDLTGVTSRFSRGDLFTAIIYPSRDVAPAYRTTVIETRDGQLHSGIVAFESADGVILQTGATTTVRIATSDMVSRIPGNRSLMPNGLLKDLKPGDLADLYSYLQTLKPPLTPGRAALNGRR
jgi:putative membrane-bound dehydrogenase-like protein